MPYDGTRRSTGKCVTMRENGQLSQTATGVKVVDKAMHMLDLFDPAHPEWGVSEIADQLRMPMSTAHRIAQALESHAFLMRSGSRYRLGMAAFDLHRRAAPEVVVPERLRPELQRLFRETDETTVLTMYDKTRHCAICVDRLEARHRLRLSINIGQLLPANAGASSKALIAFLDPPERERVLSAPLERVGPRSITDADELRAELEAVRAEGLAYSYEETNAGTWGLSSPILNRDGELIAAIGIAAPTARYSESARRRLSKAVRSAAERALKLVDAGAEAGSHHADASDA
jgi:IclR family transcriptional regulator, acetate operon repressor